MLALALLLQVSDRRPILIPVYHPRLQAEAARLWSPETGEPALLISYAASVDHLPISGRTVPIKLQFSVQPIPKGFSLEPRSLSISKQRDRESGYLVVPTRDRDVNWKVKLDAPGGGRDPEISGESRRLGVDRGLAVSDVVIGAASQGVDVPWGGDMVTLAPVGLMERTTAFELFYQVRSDMRHDSVRTMLTFSRILGDEVLDEQVITIATMGPVDSGITALHRTVKAAQFNGSRYRLDLRLETPDGRTVTRQAFLSMFDRATPRRVSVHGEGEDS